MFVSKFASVLALTALINESSAILLNAKQPVDTIHLDDDNVMIGLTHNGYTLHMENQVAISVEENPSTGYTWSLDETALQGKAKVVSSDLEC